MLKDTTFCQLLENLMINMEKKLMDTGIDAVKTASKRVV